MLQKSRELVLALVAIAFITIAYLLVNFIFQETPDPGSFFGHALGIFGFLLMIMTETLYTLRKHSRNARLGKMASWLEFHIFTGLVGPYMVVLHSAWRFNGLAGVLTLMTIIIVISGFIGRYIYTVVPRTASGIEIPLEALENQAARIEADLARLLSEDPAWRTQAAYSTQPKGAMALVFGRFWYELAAKWRDWRVQRRLTGQARIKAIQLASLRQKRDRIRRQISSLQYARRMLAIWHLIHIPLGLTLFIMAFIHAIAAIYFATLMK